MHPPGRTFKPAVSLPVTRVVLFNSGVGYFSRSGDIDGDARIDLMFPETDVNDLLKSMVLEDFGDGRIAAVSYDSREPIARTLSSFAVNLNDNPTFAGIVSQMRGERVEVVLSPGAVNQPGRLAGIIVGVEKQHVAQGSTTLEVEVLNLWCAEGLRSVRLQEIQQLKFANPVIESEFRRALEVLALGHDSQKKSVSVHFAGERKRRVQVGYVVEAPIWKTSYRLVLSEKEKPHLQGWAMVENPTDEDWSGVKMALVSGRPISFKMDLYNPLFVDRPTIDPELFASLRPVTYRGSMAANARQNQLLQQEDLRQVEGEWRRYWANDQPSHLTPERIHGGILGNESTSNGQSTILFNRGVIPNNQPSNSSGIGGLSGLGAPTIPAPLAGQQLSGNFHSEGAPREINKVTMQQSVRNVATAAALGDSFQYTIDHPVSLARQKSAMLPIVVKEIEGQRLSIYNESVQALHPLLGLNFKNTTGLHLNQGPITVFEGNVYAGDTRVLDIQPNEERIVSYAIDLGMEVDPQTGSGSQTVTSVKSVKGIVTTTIKTVEEKTYRIVNRSQTDRTLLIEHPNRSNQGFALAGTEKPLEDTPEFHRFQVAVKAGATRRLHRQGTARCVHQRDALQQFERADSLFHESERAQSDTQEATG